MGLQQTEAAQPNWKVGGRRAGCRWLHGWGGCWFKGCKLNWMGDRLPARRCCAAAVPVHTSLELSASLQVEATVACRPAPAGDGGGSLPERRPALWR